MVSPRLNRNPARAYYVKLHEKALRGLIFCAIIAELLNRNKGASKEEPHLANTKTAKKMIRVSRKKTARNTTAKSALKTTLRKAVESFETGKIEEAAGKVRQASSSLDKTAAKGIIHRNKASRKKSRLQKKLNSAQAA
jgi:small subunit ribosomal protein S20